MTIRVHLPHDSYGRAESEEFEANLWTVEPNGNLVLWKDDKPVVEFRYDAWAHVEQVGETK